MGLIASPPATQTASNQQRAQATQSQQQGQPATSITVLGNTVGISYSSKLTLKEKLEASGQLTAAAALINANADKLDSDEQKAIGQVSSVSIVGKKEADLGMSDHTMILSVSYLKDSSSTAYVASLFAHEGQHKLNTGQFVGENLWKDEQKASRAQLLVGTKLGFTHDEISNLVRWSDDANKAAMQKHMAGFTY